MRTLTIFFAVVFCGTSPLLAADTVRVVTRENAIRQDCRFVAPVKAKVRYGDQLAVVAKSGDWYRVTFKGAKGCIHRSAVEEKSVKLGRVSGKGGGATSDEVSLAGKGFNPQVESSYKGKHPELDFSAVDVIEQYQVPPDTLQEFLKSGGLAVP